MCLSVCLSVCVVFFFVCVSVARQFCPFALSQHLFLPLQLVFVTRPQLYGLRVAEYFKHKWNRFDFLVVVVSIFEICISLFTDVSSNGLSIFRSFRLLRVLRLAQSWCAQKERGREGERDTHTHAQGITHDVVFRHLSLSLSLSRCSNASPPLPPSGKPWASC